MNKVVEITMRASDGNIYRCVGVVMKKDDDMIELAFSAKNDKVVDYLNIDRKSILELKECSKINYL